MYKKKSALQSLILHSKQFVKNIQTCDLGDLGDLGALKWKKLGQSPVFSSNLAIIHYFENGFYVKYDLKRRIFRCTYRHI